MKNILNANWIKSPKLSKECEICYSKQFNAQNEVKSASLEITALGTYVAEPSNDFSEAAVKAEVEKCITNIRDL